MDTLTGSYRRRLFGVRARCLAELRILWDLWDPADETTWPRFAIPAVLRISTHEAEAQALGADYYRALRLKRLGETLSPASPDPRPTDAIETSLRVVGLAGTYTGLKLGRTPAQAKSFAFQRVALAAMRHVANGWRDAVIESTEGDDASLGWQRITTGTCAFCAQKAAEGVVPPGEAFQSHDGCACVAEPSFSLKVVPPKGGDEELRGIADFIRKGRTGDFFTAQDFRGKLLAAYPDNAFVKDLIEAGRRWTAGKFQLIRSEAESLMRGESGGPLAKALLEAIRTSPSNAPVLYRGMAMAQTPDFVAAQWVEGSTFDLALGSFTSDLKVARRFATNARAKSTTQLIIRCEKGSKALKMEGLVGDKRVWREREWLGSGRYQVVRVTKSGNTVNVTVKQRAVFRLGS